MRRTNLFGRLGRDGAASAPFAVVAVVILLGAGISYAYLASYSSSKDAAEERPAWTASADRALQVESQRIADAVRQSLDGVLAPDGYLQSETIMSQIGSYARNDLQLWANNSFPHGDGTYECNIESVDLVTVPVYCMLVAGNPLGQQTSQMLPVGLRAVARCGIAISFDMRTIVHKEVVVSISQPCPQLLAAHFQNLLEYELAEDGLVPLLMADALSTRLSAEGVWAPEDSEMEVLLEGAILAVERALFRSAPSSPPLASETTVVGGSTVLRGGALLGRPETGEVWLEMAKDARFNFTFLQTGERLSFSLSPSIESKAMFEVTTTVTDYAPAEAGGHVGATAVRATYGIEISHAVDCSVNGHPAGSVGRTVRSRSSLMALAMDRPDRDYIAGRHAQVEDWADFEAAMAPGRSCVRTLELRIAGATSDSTSSVMLDGVCLGDFAGRSVTLRNVVAGDHDLTVIPAAAAGVAASCATRVSLGVEDASSQLTVRPGAATGDAADFAFWFSLMSAFHSSGDSRVPYLDFIARLVGYPLLDRAVASAPMDDLDGLVLWEEGLSRHLGLLEDVWSPVSGPVHGDFLTAAKDLLSIYQIAHKLLVKYPTDALRVARIIVLMGTEEGRDVVRMFLESDGDTELLVEARAVDGGLQLGTTGDAALLLKSMKCGLTLVSVLTSAIAVAKDAVSIGQALADGRVADARLAGLNLSLDLARTVINVIGLLRDLGLLALGAVSKAALTLVTAAVSVISTFASAYSSAGRDFKGAMALLMNPETFNGALKTAGFVAGIGTLAASAYLGAAALTGLVVTALSAVLIATGVGAVVYCIVIVAWTALHWQKIKEWGRAWASGTATDEAVGRAMGDVQDALGGTMGLRAQLNEIDVAGDLRTARLMRGTGLAMMEVRSLLADEGLVGAVNRTDLYHLDMGAAQARCAKAVAELRYWIEVLWREVDDFVDGDHASSDGELSEGFAHDKDFVIDGLTYHHTFDADILVDYGDGWTERLSQADGSLVRFLRSLNVSNAEGLAVRLEVRAADDRIYGPAMEAWGDALSLILEEVGRSSEGLSAASRECAYASMIGTPSEYSRGLSVVEVRTGEGLDAVSCEVDSGGIWSDGALVAGRAHVDVEDGARMLVVAPGHVESTMGGNGVELEELESRCSATAPRWCDPSFGRTVLDHKVVVAKG